MKPQELSKNVQYFEHFEKAIHKVDKIILSLLLVFAITHSMNGQNLKKIDSILEVAKTQTDTTQIISYATAWAELVFIDPLASKPYLDSTIIYAERLGNESFIARTKNYLGVFYNMTSEYEKSDSIYDEVIALYAKLGDSVLMSYALNNKANSLRALGKYYECLDVHMTTLKIKEAINDTQESIAASYWNIGNIHGDIENYGVSNEYYNKAKAIYQKLGKQDDLASIKVNMAINLKGEKEYKEAKRLLKEVVPYYKKKNYYNDLAGAYDNIGWIYAQQDSFDIAENYYNEALKLSRNYGETSLVGLNLRHLGELHNEKGNYRKALQYMKQALDISEKTGTRKKKIGDLLEMSKAYAGLNRYKKAYEFHTDYHQLHEEILGQENIKRMNELEVLYQTEKKQKELIIKDNKIKLLEERKQKAENEKLFLSISLLGSSALVLALFYGFRQRSNRNKTEREKLNNELRFKEKELTTHALHLAHKNEVLLDLKSQLKALKTDIKNSRQYQNIINNINLDINNDTNWEQFKNYFEDVHRDFNSKVMSNYPEVSNNDLRLMALLKMNLSTKEIANILNISVEGVKKARYRLRKKLNLSTEDSLQELVISL